MIPAPAWHIRPATAADCPGIYALIKELAEFEREPDSVTLTLAELERLGFGPNPLWAALVAELPDGTLGGMSLWYWRFSTWRGRILYLEDLIVTQQLRGQGLGKALLDATQAVARAEGAAGMLWQVLDWNAPAIDFYRSYGANIEPQWWNCRLPF